MKRRWRGCGASTRGHAGTSVDGVSGSCQLKALTLIGLADKQIFRCIEFSFLAQKIKFWLRREIVCLQWSEEKRIHVSLSKIVLIL